MFTGIIHQTAPILGVTDGPKFKRLTLPAPFTDVKPGDSIAVNGVCLTVAELSNSVLAFDVIQETLTKTNLGLLNPGDRVHLEQALAVGDRFDGHFVQGHVDGTATLLSATHTDTESRLTLQAPDTLAKFLSPKGSVALDGVSLTIAEVNGTHFQVALIPTTLKLTLLAHKTPGSVLNLECDMLAKSVVTFLEGRR
jgi:riboflavin synthase